MNKSLIGSVSQVQYFETAFLAPLFLVGARFAYKMLKPLGKRVTDEPQNVLKKTENIVLPALEKASLAGGIAEGARLANRYFPSGLSRDNAGPLASQVVKGAGNLGVSGWRSFSFPLKTVLVVGALIGSYKLLKKNRPKEVTVNNQVNVNVELKIALPISSKGAEMVKKVSQKGQDVFVEVDVKPQETRAQTLPEPQVEAVKKVFQKSYKRVTLVKTCKKRAHNLAPQVWVNDQIFRKPVSVGGSLTQTKISAFRKPGRALGG